jgi:tetratricopeptide (TPR) repeat protein
MKFILVFITAFALFSCESDLNEKKSNEAYRKGIITLKNHSENGEPDYKEAYNYFVQATEIDPDNIKAQYWKADTELKLGKFEKAFLTAVTTLDNFQDDHRLRPNLLIIAGLSAKKYGDRGDKYLSEAIQIYEKRIIDDIDNVDAIMNKALVLCYMGRKDDAVNFLNTFSLNEENHALLEKIKVDIQNFDAETVMNPGTMKK